jgi:hypothetical protein
MSGLLLHSPADIVSRGLIALGVGNDPGILGQFEQSGTGTDIQVSRTVWPVFVGSEPEEPDNVLTVYDTVGTHDGKEMFGGETYRHHGIQVRARGRNYADCYARLNRAQTLMSETAYRNQVVIDNATYLIESFSRLQGITFIPKKPKDEDTRIRMSFNCLVVLWMLTLAPEWVA